MVSEKRQSVFEFENRERRSRLDEGGVWPRTNPISSLISYRFRVTAVEARHFGHALPTPYRGFGSILGPTDKKKKINYGTTGAQKFPL